MPLDEYIPQVIWPEQSGYYKAVQFMIEDKPYMRFRPVSSFHQMIVMDFAQEAGLESKGICAPKEKFVDNEKNKIVGTGNCNLNLEEKTALFCGWSKDYKLFINKEHMEEIRKLYPDMDIRID